MASRPSFGKGHGQCRDPAFTENNRLCLFLVRGELLIINISVLFSDYAADNNHMRKEERRRRRGLKNMTEKRVSLLGVILRRSIKRSLLYSSLFIFFFTFFKFLYMPCQACVA